MTQLQNKVIAITGAGSGIGAATARTAAQQGAALSLADIDQSALSTITGELKASGANVIASRVDVSNADNVNDWISNTIKHFGTLDGAANVAAISTLTDGEVLFNISDTTDEHWDSLMKVNLTGLFYCLRAQLRAMGQGASIVNVTSLGGLNGYAGLSAYVAGKHGVQGLTKTAAKEAGAKGIRVNAVAPGRTMTPMLNALRADKDALKAAGRTHGAENIPLRRFAKPTELAQTICFALSDVASYTTGNTFIVDGGLSL